jgi:hypothetical protein
MRNIFSKLAVVFITLALFLSCSDESTDDETKNDSINYLAFSPRISIVSQNTNIADVNVEIEGFDGNLISGAVVLVSNSINGVHKCAYDPATGSYNGKYPIPADGLIKVIINSILAPVPVTYSLFHQQIINKPIINVFEDSTGASVLLGVALDFLKEIQIGWTSCGEGIVYHISIRSALQTLYEASTESLTHFIPGGKFVILPGQIYYLQINAQRITGDPFFQENNYYSAAIRTGDTISFNVR